MSTEKTAWMQLKEMVLSTDQIRSVDRLAIEQFGMNSLVLMENAALGCVRWIQHRFPQAGRVVILCGSGNNGGDGLVIARHLAVLGWKCDVLVLGPRTKLSPDARANLEILMVDGPEWMQLVEAGKHAELAALPAADLVIDAMLGTGASGTPREPLSTWIQAANGSQAFRLAIDIPTGANTETGEFAEPSFHADATLTFVARKPAMNSGTLAGYGEIEVLPIGIPEQLIRRVVESLGDTRVG